MDSPHTETPAPEPTDHPTPFQPNEPDTSGATPMDEDPAVGNTEQDEAHTNGSADKGKGPAGPEDEAPVDDNAEREGEEVAEEGGEEGDVPEEPTPKRRKTKRETDALKKERNLAELLLLMDEYQPLIPDAVTDYYLARSGFECDDTRLKRLLALAAQKFIADVANDALHYSKIRAQQIQAKDRKGAYKDKRNVLTMDDLSNALAEHGVNVKKPDYFV
ncbi:Transcription initiation factor TFIID subunit 10 [Rhizophlyctis rosea]|nr:Transcription initiation factor TFIID subunit 10 [Rhizophlyctis rosea]